MVVTWGIVLVTPLLMTVTMITRPVSSLYTQLRIECMGLGPVPVWRSTRIMSVTMTMTMITRPVSSVYTQL